MQQINLLNTFVLYIANMLTSRHCRYFRPVLGHVLHYSLSTHLIRPSVSKKPQRYFLTISVTIHINTDGTIQTHTPKFINSIHISALVWATSSDHQR